jgi:two-component system, response regulator PdtaR
MGTCCHAMEIRSPALPVVVLIVEDEPFTRFMAADVLSRSGLAVREALCADEALTILEAQADVRAVFTDVEMPGSLDGLALARQIGERWPSIGVVVTSAFPRYADKVPERCGFLSKPYTGPELIRQIREVTMPAGSSDPKLAERFSARR